MEKTASVTDIRDFSRLANHEKKLADLFDVSKMSVDSMRVFIRTPNFRNSAKKCRLRDPGLFQSLLNGSGEDINLCKEGILKVIVLELLRSENDIGQTYVDYSTGKLDIDSESDYSKKRVYRLYRGQSQYEWNLCPSLFRKVLESKPAGNYFFDGKSIAWHYKEKGIEARYNELFKTDFEKKQRNSERNAKMFSYVSFLQHSLCYTPFLDFTKDIYVATYFATDGPEISKDSDFKDGDGAVFQITFKRKRGSFLKDSEFNWNLLDDCPVYFVDGKIVPGETISFQNALVEKDKPKYLHFSDPSKIKKLLKPKFKIFEKETNDRMKAQQGVFGLFSGFVAPNKNILFRLCDNLEFVKKLSVPDKKSYFYQAKDKTKFSTKGGKTCRLDCLLDPYSFFKV